ncbi:MAG: HD-GYP domain-containing protein [Anaerocolumna sp.]
MKVLSNNLENQPQLRDDLEEAIDHGILVSKLAFHLAKEMDLPKEFCYAMAEAGLLHDIGKLKLGKYLYGRKKNALIVEEMKYIRMHSTLGYNILKKFNYSEDVCEGVHHHHENYDGSGYPHNIKGESIPLGARILRICDVYATLISDRRNRIAFDQETAIKLMIEEIKNFDMKIFLIFVTTVNKEEYKDIESFINYLNSKEFTWSNILHDGYY